MERGPRGVYAVRKFETGETSGVRASGATTKILFRWEGGYWDKCGCTGKGGGGGGGRRETGTTKTHEGPRATKGSSGVNGLGTQRLGLERPLSEGGMG